ncbi:MAG: efflux RND transporter permease subunit, partial [Acidobacteriota bacterium]
ALGAGAESRRSMGIAVIGGLVIGGVLTLYVIPAMYSYLASRTVRAATAGRDAAGSDEKGARETPELASPEPA